MAGVANFEVNQFATFDFVITYKDNLDVAIDLTGYSAKMVIGNGPNPSVTYLTLTDGAGITLGGAAGTLEIEVTDEQTSLFTFDTAYYDVVITSSGGEKTRLVQGKLTNNKGVTT